MLRIENLSKSYGEKLVLKDINLQFLSGEVHGIVGNNGSGKSTLFRCIAGMEHYSGTIISNYGVLKDHLGFLETDPFFFSRITGREYLTLVGNARKIKISDLDEKNIFDLPLSEFAINYSTGMKKKLAFTGILLQNNAFFILDEPFNGLDLQSNMIVSEIILQLKQLKKTILISSHIFSTLNDCCDQLHILKNGAIEKSVSKSDFAEVEQELKQLTIGDKIEKLNLK